MDNIIVTKTEEQYRKDIDTNNVSKVSVYENNKIPQHVAFISDLSMYLPDIFEVPSCDNNEMYARIVDNVNTLRFKAVELIDTCPICGSKLTVLDTLADSLIICFNLNCTTAPLEHYLCRKLYILTNHMIEDHIIMHWISELRTSDKTVTFTSILTHVINSIHEDHDPYTDEKQLIIDSIRNLTIDRFINLVTVLDVIENPDTFGIEFDSSLVNLINRVSNNLNDNIDHTKSMIDMTNMILTNLELLELYKRCYITT